MTALTIESLMRVKAEVDAMGPRERLFTTRLLSGSKVYKCGHLGERVYMSPEGLQTLMKATTEAEPRAEIERITNIGNPYMGMQIEDADVLAHRILGTELCGLLQHDLFRIAFAEFEDESRKKLAEIWEIVKPLLYPGPEHEQNKQTDGELTTNRDNDK